LAALDWAPWHLFYQEAQHWIKIGRFAAVAHDLRVILRPGLEGRADPGAVILDSSPHPKVLDGFDGHMKCKGWTMHAAVISLDHLLARAVTPANE